MLSKPANKPARFPPCFILANLSYLQLLFARKFYARLDSRLTPSPSYRLSLFLCHFLLPVFVQILCCDHWELLIGSTSLAVRLTKPDALWVSPPLRSHTTPHSWCQTVTESVLPEANSISLCFHCFKPFNISRVFFPFSYFPCTKYASNNWGF